MIARRELQRVGLEDPQRALIIESAVQLRALQLELQRRRDEHPGRRWWSTVTDTENLVSVLVLGYM